MSLCLCDDGFYVIVVGGDVCLIQLCMNTCTRSVDIDRMARVHLCPTHLTKAEETPSLCGSWAATESWMARCSSVSMRAGEMSLCSNGGVGVGEIVFWS